MKYIFENVNRIPYNDSRMMTIDDDNDDDDDSDDNNNDVFWLPSGE